MGCMARVAACEFHRPGQFWRAVVVLLRLLCIVSSHLGGEPQRGVKATPVPCCGQPVRYLPLDLPGAAGAVCYAGWPRSRLMLWLRDISADKRAEL
jgi:hypothetical protein